MAALARLLVILLATLGLGGTEQVGRVAGGVTSISIRSTNGVTRTVTRPATVARIAEWFEALPPFVPRPCPYLSYTPPTVIFVFHGPGVARETAVDRAPGTCSGEIGHGRGKALADNGFVAQVSRLLGVNFDPNARTQQNIAAAKVDAAQHLGLVRVPAGSRPLAKPTTPRAYRSFAQADTHRTWRVHVPFADVLTFEKAHPPTGSSLNSTDSDSNPNGITMQFLFRPVAHRISGRAVDIAIDPLAGGWTRISVVAFTSWVIVRSLDEKVPARVRAIVVHGNSRDLRIANPEQVARIVLWIDTRPPARPARPSRCHVSTASGYSPPWAGIDFLGAHGTKLASASTGWCDGTIGFEVGGRDEAPLAGGFTVRQIERLSR